MSKKTKSPDASKATKKPVAASESSRSPMFDPLERLHLADWFDRWPEIFSRRWPEAFNDLSLIGAGFRMEQLVEEDGTLVVRGELPGLDPDNDVTITIDDDRMTIAAQREERSEDSENGTRRSEFQYGSLQRSFPLPVGAQRDEIVATYDSGILEVRIPVDASTESVTTIPVTRN